MDWSKAKTIIIVALIAVNIFLLGVYRDWTGKSQAEEQADVLEETLALLENRDIDLKVELPESAGEVAACVVDRIAINETTINTLLSQEEALPVEERTEEYIRAKAQAFLERLGVWNEDTFISKYEVGGDGSVLMTFGSSIKGIPVEISNLYCYVSDGKVSVVIGVWMTGSDQGQTPHETILPVRALLDFAGQVPREYDKNGELVPLHIINMEMVYRFDNDAMLEGTIVSDTAFPYWKFTYIVGSEEESVSELGAKISVVKRVHYVNGFAGE